MVNPKLIQTYFPPIIQRPDAFGRFGRLGSKTAGSQRIPDEANGG